MKVLIVHNDYGNYSGEEAVVDQFIADLRSEGIDIEVYRRTSKFQRNSFFGNIHGFFSGVYSISGVQMMRQALETYRPDVVHIHNLYPFISPAALFECKKVGVPVVMTVHNYRLLCPTGLFLRNGRPCEACLQQHSEWLCVKHNCEGFPPRSLGYAVRNYVARKTGAYTKCVDYFCCLTDFQKQKLIEGGFPAEKLVVFPNYTEATPGYTKSCHLSVAPIYGCTKLADCERKASECPKANGNCPKCAGIFIPKDEKGLQRLCAGGSLTEEGERRFVGYVGRLSEEKGYDLLLEVARRHPEIPFRFAGAKRDKKEENTLPNVELCGLLSKEQLAQFYRKSLFIVIPSRCYEGFPLTLLDAFNHGKPCVAPNHGAFPNLIQDEGKMCGRLFEPLNIDDLERNIVELWNHHDEVSTLGRNAIENVKAHYLKSEINARWTKFLFDVIESKSKVNTFTHQ